MQTLVGVKLLNKGKIIELQDVITTEPTSCGVGMSREHEGHSHDVLMVELRWNLKDLKPHKYNGTFVIVDMALKMEAMLSLCHINADSKPRIFFST